MKNQIFYLDRPEVSNALDLETAKNLEKFLKQSKSPGIIIASKNPKVFCAGGDLKAYSKMKTKAQGVKTNAAIRKILQSLSKSPMAVVAAVEGACIGGGCELALSCDYIIASSSSRFAFMQVKMGLTPGWGVAARLLSRVRPSTAFDWLSSGRWITSQEALRAGLVDEIVPAGITIESAVEFLAQRSSLSPKLLKNIKQVVVTGGKDEEKIFNSLWFSREHRLTR